MIDGEHRPFHVLLDCTVVAQTPGGVGRYSIELARALARMAHEQAEDLRLDIFERWGHMAALEGEQVRVHQVGARGRLSRLAWENVLLARVLQGERPDVVHSTFHTTPPLGFGAARLTTIHDVSFREQPWLFSRKWLAYIRAVTAASTRLAQGIIVPSRATEEAYRRFYKVRQPLRVIPEGVTEEFFRPQGPAEVAEARMALGLPERYFLMVARSSPLKNRNSAVQAFASLASDYPDVVLAVAGPRVRGEEPLAVSRNLGQRVRELGYVPQQYMPALYAGAAALVFPSLNEGFGLPILETMAAGTPVITSDRGACPEVAGDAALIVYALDTGALAVAMQRVLDDPDLAEDLSQRGKKRASGFNWEETARRTLAFYREVAAASRYRRAAVS